MTDKKIYKYALNVTDEQTIIMPQRWKPLAVQFQGNQLCLWALVEVGRTYDGPVSIRVVGTGNPFEDADECHYIGTVQQPPLVWHVFHKDHR
jgi:hypothetical protein